MNGIRKFKQVCLDSNLFIYHFEENSEFVSATSFIFDSLSEGTLKASTSIISLIEVLSYPLPPAVLREIKESFQSLPNLTVYNVESDIAGEAARIRREYGFRLPDAIQLATAVTAKADVFITNDQKLKQFKQLKVLLLSSV